MEEFLFRRQSNTCYGNKQWYVCSKGDFKGCCSADPCTTGICPDDVGSSSSSTIISSELFSSSLTTSTSSASVSESTTTTVLTSYNVSPTGSSTGSSTNSPSTTPGTTATLSSPKATAAGTPNSNPTSHAAIIGGAVGGVVGLILCIALALLCWRRRQRNNQAQHVGDMATVSPANGPWSENGTRSKGSFFVTSTSEPNTFSNGVPGAFWATSLGSSILDCSTNQTLSTGPSNKNSPETTPELSDTGFYRTRAELAS